MKRSLAYIFTLCVTLLACTLVMQASPIVNGTFYPSVSNPQTGATYTWTSGTGIANPWAFSNTHPYDRSGVVGSASGWGYVPMSGSYNAFLEGTSTISQTLFTLTPGDSYTVTFYLTARSGYSVDPVDVFVEGKLLGQFTPVQGNGWTIENVSFKATSGSELLTFEGMDQYAATGCGTPTHPKACDYNTGLDNVTDAVPEPALALLLPFGLLFVSGLRKRFLA